MIQRGLRAVKSITSDDQAGLKSARKVIFPGVPGSAASSTCSTMHRVMSPSCDSKVPVSCTIHSIFNPPDTNEATQLLDLAIKFWRSSHPKLAAWAETNLAEGFTVFRLPPEHRVRMRKNNGLGG